MTKLLDFLIQRFVDEWVALELDIEGNYNMVCAVDNLSEEDKYYVDAVVKCAIFNLFGYGLFPKVIGEPISWKEYNDSHNT